MRYEQADKIYKEVVSILKEYKREDTILDHEIPRIATPLGNTVPHVEFKLKILYGSIFKNISERLKVSYWVESNKDNTLRVVIHPL